MGVELFTTVSAGRDVAGTVNGLDGDVTDGPVGGVPVAVADACAHRRTPLSGGLVRDGILTCPGHFWRYDLRTGQCINRPDRVASHPCRVVDGWVDVLVPDPAPALGVRAMLLAAARRHAAAGPTMAGGDDPPAPS